jgi:hypothetical protein
MDILKGPLSWDIQFKGSWHLDDVKCELNEDMIRNNTCFQRASRRLIDDDEWSVRSVRANPTIQLNTGNRKTI